MQKDDLVYLGHMLDTVRKALNKTCGKSRSDYDNDENLRLALTHLIQIIGEAACRVSSKGRTAHPKIPWSEIIGMRHKVVHDYLDVDEDIVWQVVKSDLPCLMSTLERIVPPEEVDA